MVFCIGKNYVSVRSNTESFGTIERSTRGGAIVSAETLFSSARSPGESLFMEI